MHWHWLLPCLTRYSQHARNIVSVYPATARATWNEVGLLLLKEITLLLKKSVAGAQVCWCCWILCLPVVGMVVGRVSFQIFGRGNRVVVVVVVVVGFARGFHGVPLTLSVRAVCCLLWVPAVHEIALHGVPRQAVLCCADPGTHTLSDRSRNTCTGR